MMTSQELATAAQYNAAVIVLIVNNGMYGTIRTPQGTPLPGTGGRNRPAEPRLRGPGQGLRRLLGMRGKYRTIRSRIERAQAAKRLAVLELKIDPDALTIRQSLSDIRAAALAARKS